LIGVGQLTLYGTHERIGVGVLAGILKKERRHFFREDQSIKPRKQIDAREKKKKSTRGPKTTAESGVTHRNTSAWMEKDFLTELSEQFVRTATGEEEVQRTPRKNRGNWQKQ